MWKIVERRIGQAGGIKQREAKQRAWDHKYGPERWCIGFLLEGEFIPYEDALDAIYLRSYEAFFEEHPEELEALATLAKRLRNPHAEATTGADLQIPVILSILRRRGMSLQGTEVVDIGSWKGQASHPISIRLSPLTIPCVLDRSKTLEAYWQEKKCLATWQEESQDEDAEDSFRPRSRKRDPP